MFPPLLPAQAMLVWLVQHYSLVHTTTAVISLCAVLHTILPPWDWNPEFVAEGLADFPELQNIFYRILHNRYYKLLVYVIGYVALHARSTVWRSISVNNPKSVNANFPKGA